MRRYAGVLAAVAMAACAKTETPEQRDARITTESQAARTAIEAVNAQFMAHFNAGHADSVAQYYTQDAVVMQPNDRTVAGRDSIRATLAQMFGWGSWQLSLRTEHVVANGPIAVERGRFTLSFAPTPGGGAPMPAMSDSGKFLVHWHNVAGTWRLAEDIWNSDVPLPPPPRRRG